MRIVSIHAHPDDAEILAGGTLALLAKCGHQITIVTMSPGDCGSAHLEPNEIARIRRMEASASAALIGAEYVCADFHDLAIFNDGQSRRRVTELLRETRPEVVLTASPSDYLCDHEATSRLVRDACFAACVPNYSSGGAKPLDAIPHLYFMDPIEMLVTPDFTIDAESAMEMKRAMLSQHQSQRLWLKRQHGVDDYILKMEEWTRSRGASAGIAWGEGFRQYCIHPYPQTPALQELLAGFVVS